VKEKQLSKILEFLLPKMGGFVNCLTTKIEQDNLQIREETLAVHTLFFLYQKKLC